MAARLIALSVWGATLQGCTGTPAADVDTDADIAAETAGETAGELAIGASIDGDREDELHDGSPTLFFDLTDVGDSSGPAATLVLEHDGESLVARYTFAPHALARAGANAVLSVEHVDGDGEAVRLAPSGFDAEGAIAASGEFTLRIAAHRLRWQDATLRLRLIDANGQLHAGVSAPLAPALAAGTRALAPAVSLAGERIGDALDFSHDGGWLGLTRPAQGRILLVARDTDGATGLDDAWRVPIDGLQRADPDSIRVAIASLGASVAVVRRELGRQRLSIADAHGEGWIDAFGTWLDDADDVDLHIDGVGRRVDLLHADGRVTRFDRDATSWNSTWQPAPADSLGAAVIGSDGTAYHLLQGSNGWQLASGAEPEPLPQTDARWRDALPGGARLALDAGGLTLAVATLHAPPGSERARLLLSIWTRDEASGATGWRAVARIERGLTAVDAEQTLAFGSSTGVAADTLLWRWQAPSESTSASRVADRGAATASGLVVLRDRSAAAAFGRAARSGLPHGRWEAAFELPRDGLQLQAIAPPDSAALSPDGTTLAVGWPPTRSTRTAAGTVRDGVAVDGPPRPAGVIRLID